MRVLHVISTIALSAGGPTRVLADMTRAQLARGHQVTILATDRDNPSRFHLKHDAVELLDRRTEIKLFKVNYAPLLFSLDLMFYLIKTIAKFDIVHVHGSYRFPPAIACIVARFKNIPYIIRPHGNLDPYLARQSSVSLRLKRLYEKIVDFPNFNRADGIQYTAMDEQAEAGRFCFRAPSAVVPNGIDWPAFSQLPASGAFRKELGIEPTHPLVLFLGRLNFKKGLDLLVPAFALVAKTLPNARLVIVGADNEGYAETIRAMVKSHNLETAVSFVAMLPAADIQRAYVDADLFVLPSYGENFGMTVIEALACGTPVLISDRVNIHRDIAAAGVGVVVPCDIAIMAAEIKRLLKDRKSLKKMGARGRLWVKQNYDWSIVITQLEALYCNAITHRVLNSRRGKAG